MWHILTGEYPPSIGGVADHACIVAKGLVDTGAEVHVWAPQCGVDESDDRGGVHVHRLADHFGARALKELSRCTAAEDRILVEYVPHAFGFKSANVLFCLWLYSRRRLSITVLFHEVAYALTLHHRMRYNALGIVHRVMAGIVGRSAEHILVTIPAWKEMLRPVLGRKRCVSIEVVPTMNLTPVVRDVEGVARLHQLYASNKLLIGTFGTYGGSLAPMLEQVLPRLLRMHPKTTALLLGANGDRFAEGLYRGHPELRGRVFGPGVLKQGQLSLHLSACDLLLQPYPDGATGRRSSLMAGLAHGRPVVTTIGPLSEPLWAESGAVCAAPSADIEEFIGLAARVIEDADLREQLSCNGARLYAERFGLSRTIVALRRAELSRGALDPAQFGSRESIRG